MTSIDPTKMDADLLREIAKNVEAATPGFPTEYQGKLRTWARRLNALLPDPAPRTLAELIEDGHAPEEYQWMQAEHRDERCIIIRALGHDSKLTVSLLTATGATIWTSTDKVIPLPDKPRLVWPDEFNPEPAEDSSTPEVAPKVLVAEEDYLNAPEGTICAVDGKPPIYTNTWAWHIPGGRTYDHSAVAGTPRSVLRWGLGEQA